jgi:uncharacterized peroxidase-related enzyme
MRLRCVESGHDPTESAVLDLIRSERGMEPPDVLKTLHYRPELFGRPFSDALDLAMRGPSDWSAGERELFAGFVSSLNQCPFWTGAHGAVASYALGEEVWEAVRGDWRTAPVDERLRATLGFLETLTLRPGDLTRADADAVLSAGVSEEALVDAIHVAALFNMIDRLADSLGWSVPSENEFLARAEPMLDSGYALQTL